MPPSQPPARIVAELGGVTNRSIRRSNACLTNGPGAACPVGAAATRAPPDMTTIAANTSPVAANSDRPGADLWSIIDGLLQRQPRRPLVPSSGRGALPHGTRRSDTRQAT